MKGRFFERIGEGIRKKTRELKKGVLMVSIAYRDPRLGLLPKILAFITIAYAFSPIDLIPDFIPVLGLLDDLVILPLLLAAAIKSIPEGVLEDARAKAQEETGSPGRRWFFVPLIIALWIAAAAAVAAAVLRRTKRA